MKNLFIDILRTYEKVLKLVNKANAFGAEEKFLPVTVAKPLANLIAKNSAMRGSLFVFIQLQTFILAAFGKFGSDYPTHFISMPKYQPIKKETG
jgi:hypothetical protein